ncbi:TetR/AcrR family transcriptional regulator [Actinokineospora sp. G85]|uniref:TetR/AcrR family transcriptional regulator n=1 Tax=Actinokineospora sp. G85 TaxID=3406626 RepID=UPI003C78F826
MTDATSGARRYGGREANERQDERRARLVDAALDLFGTQGYASSSVKHVCERAGLTQRYFYESFTDREQLLRHVYDQQADLARAAVSDAVARVGEDMADRIRAGLAALIDALTADPRRGRVVLIEIVGVSPELETHRRGAMHEFVRYIAGLVPDEAGTLPAHRLETGVMVLVGGVTEVLVDHILGYRSTPAPELVEIIAALFWGGYRALGKR